MHFEKARNQFKFKYLSHLLVRSLLILYLRKVTCHRDPRFLALFVLLNYGLLDKSDFDYPKYLQTCSENMLRTKTKESHFMISRIIALAFRFKKINCCTISSSISTAFLWISVRVKPTAVASNLIARIANETCCLPWVRVTVIKLKRCYWRCGCRKLVKLATTKRWESAQRTGRSKQKVQ